MNRSGYIYILFILAFVVIIMGFSYKGASDISIKKTFTPTGIVGSEKPVKYFGVVSRYSPREIYQGYQPIMDYLTETTSFRFELKLNDSYLGTAKQLSAGDISIASLGTYIYLSYRDEYNLKVILKPLNENGVGTNRLVFIAQLDSQIQSIHDIKNARLVLPSKESLTGQWMPTYIMQETGLKLSDFQEIHFASHHTTVAELVFQNKYDVGIIKEPVSRLAIKKGLRIFHIAPPIPTSPIVVSNKTDSTFVDEVVGALLKINLKDDSMAMRITSWDNELSNGFHQANNNDYLSAKALIDSMDFKK
ncbi:MAG: phosphate/phosphite/phosphonate ABC transporter substrate-binding protein [Candidatus Marinimicrobia bacterium]|nr:phosphate/phosphite/phosphonate ABC transporter substrate-binding protein [Candidatus Neomarinimicrobiota bacterium]